MSQGADMNCSSHKSKNHLPTPMLIARLPVSYALSFYVSHTLLLILKALRAYWKRPRAGPVDAFHQRISTTPMPSCLRR
ncbi:hypothetical protein BJX70DRAFT_352701 [Aspergillus crustosus]